MQELCVIVVIFNPAKFKGMIKNCLTFLEQLKRQKVDYLLVECSFDGTYDLPDGDNVLRIESKSVMWLKECLINYGLSKLPKQYKYFAWIDADVLLPDNWAEMAVEKLKNNDIIQLFEKIIFLSKTGGETISCVQGVWKNTPGAPEAMLFSQEGVIHQFKNNRHWLRKRIIKYLGFGHPGMAWAARREVFEDIGIYDKNIVGSGDIMLVDALLDSYVIHKDKNKFPPLLINDVQNWTKRLKLKNPTFDYLPIDICHLWHGELANRNYELRHKIMNEHKYDPTQDIVLKDGIYQWATDKPKMHNDLSWYFFDRKEDI